MPRLLRPLTSGLISGPAAAISRRLADTYLSKPETLILLCLSAGGRE